VGGFFFGVKFFSLGYKKKGGDVTRKKEFFWEKKGLPYFEGGKKRKVEFTIFRP
jgi:hypothetical protein